MQIENLVPRRSCWFPTSEVRNLNNLRAKQYDPTHFENYGDYFFFLHIDPYTRFWHSFGMVVGTGFFILLLFNWTNWYWNIAFYLLGVLFFYGFGIISHAIYDGGAAKSKPKYFVVTTVEVVRFNFLTLTGRYQRYLQEQFLPKYPFTAVAYDLIPSSLVSMPQESKI